MRLPPSAARTRTLLLLLAGLCAVSACGASSGGTGARSRSAVSAFAGGATRYQAESFDVAGTSAGIFSEAGGQGLSVAGFSLAHPVMEWKAIALNGAGQISFALGAPYGGGSAELWADGVGASKGGTLLGTVRLNAATGGDWNAFVTQTFSIAPLAGTHDLYLRATATGGDWLYKLDWFELPLGSGAPDGGRIQAETWDALGTSAGIFNEAGGDGLSVAGFSLAHPDLQWDDVPLNGAQSIQFALGAPYGGGTAELWADARGTAGGGTRIGVIQLTAATGDWNTFVVKSFPIVALPGRHKLFLHAVATGGDWLYKLDWFQLGAGTPPPPPVDAGLPPPPVDAGLPPPPRDAGVPPKVDGGTVPVADGGFIGPLVGLGSFTVQLPPGARGPSDFAGNPVRPRITPNVRGPVPTNDWWSSLVWPRFADNPYSENLFALPLSLHAHGNGLGIGYTATPTLSGNPNLIGEYHANYVEDFVLGVPGLASPDTRVDGFTDWTVTALWSDGTHSLRATFGHGLPFVYATATGGGASLSFASAPTVFANNGAVLGLTVHGNAYGVFAPSGSQWTLNGSTLTSTLGGKDYFSVVLLPDAQPATLSAYAQYAYAFVTGTRVKWSYDAANGVLHTAYQVTTSAKEGSASGTLLALYPHQWRHTSDALTAYRYASPRGTLKVRQGASFQTSLVFNGVLPSLPAAGIPDTQKLYGYVNDVYTEASHALGGGAGTYWTGKSLGRLAALVRIAEQVGHTQARDAFLAAIKSVLQDWFSAPNGKSSHVFYYEPTWGTLIGYPAEYGSDTELNDHHFHYGYYLMAAATVAQYDRTWASPGQWGGMVDVLVRDVANPVGDSQFPALRNFDPYEGHSWASGHAAFVSGNNQESSSESMNFNAGLVLWGAATGDASLRDLGIYLYATEAETVDEAWYNLNADAFPAAGFNHTTAGMVWGNGAAYATWFTAIPSQIHGINMLPITGGSLYLGRRPALRVANHQEMVTNNGGESASTIWADINWEAYALGDGAKAAALLDANPGFAPEDGETRAHSYHWVHALATLGNLDASVTSSLPTATAFISNGARTYAAYNPTGQTVTVAFSTGQGLTVGPYAMASGPGSPLPPGVPVPTPSASTCGQACAASSAPLTAASGCSAAGSGQPELTGLFACLALGLLCLRRRA